MSFQLPTFGAPRTVAVTTTTPAFGGFAPLAAPTMPPTTTIPAPIMIGLGGTATSTATNDIGGTIGGAREQCPMDTIVPPEINAVIEELRKHLKENKQLSDEMAMASVDNVKTVGEDVLHAAQSIASLDARMHNCNKKAHALADRARGDLRHAESVQRLHDTIPTHSLRPSAQPIHYLHSLSDDYDQVLLSYREQLDAIEAFVRSRLGDDEDAASVAAPTDEQLLAQLKKMDEAFKYVAANAYQMHSLVEDAKDDFLQYRRSVFGDGAANPFRKQKEKSTITPAHIEGPDPFVSPSQTLLMNMAQMLGKGAQVPTTSAIAPSFGASTLFAPSQPAFSGFGTSTTATTAAAPLFRAFGSIPSSTSTATTSAPSAFTGFGAPPSLPTTTTAPQSTFTFGNTVNSSIGGTLFGGSATKPFGK